MGKLALAAKITHVPSMYLCEFPGPNFGKRDAAVAGHKEIARRCRALGVDTIVVFDRIRENFRRVRGITPEQTIDLSLTETLRRTIMTISTVLLVVLAMLFLGGDGLYWFSVALFIGLLAGTYSSTYIASSIPLRMGLSRDDFIVKVKPEFEEEIVTFNDPKMFEQDNV